MSKKQYANNFLILDTETTIKGENMPYQSVFDIGWTISDREGNILQKRSYVVQEFFKQAIYSSKAFLIDSGFLDSSVYIEKIRRLDMKVEKWSEIIKRLKADSTFYGVEYVGAYNLAFDMRVIEKTQFTLGSERTFDNLNYFENYFLIDLYPACVHTVLDTVKYKEFAIKHNLITEKGNFQCGAEPSYKFLFNEPNYIEEHTALQDSIDETKILHYLLNNYENIPLYAFSVDGQAWRHLNRKEEE